MSVFLVISTDRKERIIKAVRLFVAATVASVGGAVLSGIPEIKMLSFSLFAVFIAVTIVLLLDWWREARKEPTEWKFLPSENL